MELQCRYNEREGWRVVNKNDIRANIIAAEQKISELPGSFVGDNDSCPLKHSFAPGVYVREISIPAGYLIVGKIHKHEHPNFLLKGEVSVYTESGGIERLKAPMSMISPAMTKRVVYAHTDTVWTTIHITNETDLEKIEQEIILPSYDDCEQIEVKK